MTSKRHWAVGAAAIGACAIAPFIVCSCGGQANNAHFMQGESNDISVGGGGTARTGGADGAVAGGSGVRAGTGGEAGALPAACRDIDYVDVGEGPVESVGCPVDPSLAECASLDVGALVARSVACLTGTTAARGCTPRQLEAKTMLVVIPFQGGCGIHDRIDSVQSCAGTIKIAYSLLMPCGQCDATRSMQHLLRLPIDSQPVEVSSTHVAPESCP